MSGYQLRGKAYLFGLNYSQTPEATLSGCINDVNNAARFISSEVKIPVKVFTDEQTPEDTTYSGMLGKLFEIALDSWKENLDYVWIHYSGHGSYVRDTNGDDLDGCDECLIPSDFMSAGVITDDVIQKVLSSINPNTKVVCFFDCCHSATMGDLRYSWQGPAKCIVENPRCQAKAKVLTISGCLDNQTSAETYSVAARQAVGAMTDALLRVLRTRPQVRRDVFLMVNALQEELARSGFSQRPRLCSSYLATKDRIFLSKY